MFAQGKVGGGSDHVCARKGRHVAGHLGGSGLSSGAGVGVEWEMGFGLRNLFLRNIFVGEYNEIE